MTSNASAQASSDEAAESHGSRLALKTHLKPLLNFASLKAKGAVGRAMHIDAQRRRHKVIGEDGLAANPDHIVVRDLGLELAREFPNVQVILFEDLPYLWHERGDASAARVAQTHNLTLEKVSVPLDAQAKFDHLQRYASQMPVMDTAGRLTRRECIEAYENYWLLK